MLSVVHQIIVRKREKDTLKYLICLMPFGVTLGW